MAVGADLVLPASIQADVVDADTELSGEQRTGLYFALWAMATKLALALSALALPVLASGGFDATALDATGRSQNTPDALLMLSLLYAGLPIIVKVGAMALMWNFPLDASRQRDIRSKIETAGTVS
jgi:Na+/melibiose symporter-like transporter